MSDFSMIPNYPLATGAAISSQADVDQLKAAGINSVIDCQSERDDGQLLAPSGMAYLWDGRDDNGQVGPAWDSWWKKGLDFAVTILTPAQVLQDRASVTKPVLYTHCAAGVNRGPSMAYGVLRAVFALDPTTAERAIRAARPQVGLAYRDDFERFWKTHG